jgi:hypothetical protein
LLGCWDLSVSCPDGLRRFDLGEPLKLKNKSLKPKINRYRQTAYVPRPFVRKLKNRMLIFVHPAPGFRIQQQQKRGGGKPQISHIGNYFILNKHRKESEPIDKELQ